MNKRQFSGLVSSLVLISTISLSSCSSSDVEDNSQVVYDPEGNAGVKPEFVISIPRSVVGSTRMSNDVTQNEGTSEQFRGLDNIHMIPFASVPTTTSSSLSDIMGLSSIQALNKQGTLNYKVYADQYVPLGTKHFLFYAKAIDNDADVDITSMSDKFKYGVIHATGLSNGTFTNPNGVSFSLEQINTNSSEQAGNTVGRNIIQLMSGLANTTVSSASAPDNAWSTTTNLILARLYRNFIGTTVSSSSSVAAILAMLYNGFERVPVGSPARQLADALKSKINDACSSTPIFDSTQPVSLISDYSGYPGNIGLPDGAARVRWDATNQIFVDITANYNQNLKMPITDYVYPAALWYYVSTPLKASNTIKSTEYDEQANWNSVISNVYKGAADEVGASTLSVALTEPVQYAVGRIETKITMGTGTFYDGNGDEVVIGNGYKLKGLLIGGQNSCGFDFASRGNESQTIYDVNMASSITAKPGVTTSANQTLALETKKDQVIYAALELVNGGEQFMGFDGIIPAGGTFYLPTVLNPQAAANYVSGTRDKIVMKDHVTKLTVTIKNGTNTPPDRNGDGNPDKYVLDPNDVPIGVDADGDGQVDPYDIDGDGSPDAFITDPDKGGPGWDTDGDGYVDLPVLPDPTTGLYPTYPNTPGGLGNATNGIPNLASPGIELGTSVNLDWQEGLILTPNI